MTLKNVKYINTWLFILPERFFLCLMGCWKFPVEEDIFFKYSGPQKYLDLNNTKKISNKVSVFKK